MTILLIVAGALLLLTLAGVWVLKRKLAAMAQHLPDAIQQWEKEIEKLEKPKG